MAYAQFLSYWSYWLVALTFLLFDLGSAYSAPPVEVAAVAKLPPSFDRTMLVGVWEAVAYDALGGPLAASDQRRVNAKYCFSPSQAWIALAPQNSDDSADGWAQYDVVRDLLVLDYGFGASVLRVRSLTANRLVLLDDKFAITLRRISRTVDPEHFKTRVLRPRIIMVPQR